jgi:TPR repeat protein
VKLHLLILANLQEAALKGHPDSCFELFKIFSKGSGLEKESKMWLQRAAQTGHPEALKLAALQKN